MAVRKIFVDCWRNGKRIASFEYGLPIALLPGLPKDRNKLIDEAMSQLTTGRIAFPPYHGITFKVRD